jgi:DNA-binding winged helix-turn-helix (wHTH) protein/tetratricopeptide (TPR) repeat protein
MGQEANGVYTFSSFSYDIEAETLCRKGIRMRIAAQARIVLSALLQQAGEIVTRDQLRALLWPDGEHLDYDHAINKIVGHIRYLLGESRNYPLYIETIPKLGYRFIAPVHFSPPSEIQLTATEIAISDRTTSALAVHKAHAPASFKFVPKKYFLHVALYLIAVILLVSGSWALYLRNHGQDSKIVNLGIPPFDCAGQNSESVSEGFRMDLINALSEMPALQIRAAHSLSMPLNDESSIRSVTQAQKLDMLLFGKMIQNGDRFILRLELVRGADAVHLRSFAYQGSISELGTVREKIRGDLFKQLGLARHGEWKTQTALANPIAYQSYLEARKHFTDWSDDSIRKALVDYQHAIDEDPSFADAYAGQASALIVLTEHGSVSRDQGYRKAEESANKALQLKPDNAEAHAILGHVSLRRDYNFSTAERELRQAIELDPSRADYRIWLAVMLADLGRFDDSLKQIEIAKAADPNWAQVYRTEIYVDDAAGHNADAVKAGEKLTTLMPLWPLAYEQRAWAYWAANRYQEAIADWRHEALLADDPLRLKIEDEGLIAYKTGGVKAYAAVRLKYIHSGKPLRFAVMDFSPVEWECIAGNTDKALAEAEKMVRQHNPDALQLGVIETLWPLHAYPRFSAALASVGLHPSPVNHKQDEMSLLRNLHQSKIR